MFQFAVKKKSFYQQMTEILDFCQFWQTKVKLVKTQSKKSHFTNKWQKLWIFVNSDKQKLS